MSWPIGKLVDAEPHDSMPAMTEFMNDTIPSAAQLVSGVYRVKSSRIIVGWLLQFLIRHVARCFVREA